MKSFNVSFINIYLSSIKSASNNLPLAWFLPDLDGESGGRPLLEKVYIDLLLSPAAARRQEYLPFVGGGEGNEGAVPDEWRSADDFHFFEHSLTWQQLLERGRAWLVTGRPGTGKTTLLNMIAVECCNCLLAMNAQANSGPAFLPVPVHTRRLVQYLTESSDQPSTAETLFGYVDAFVRETAPGYGEQVYDSISRVIRKSVKNGSALLLVDGLDETAATDSSTVTTIFTDLVRSYPDCRVLATARTSGAGMVHTDLGISRAEIQPFTEKDVKELQEQWYGPRVYFKSEALSPGLRVLLRNPLYCTIAIWFYRGRGLLPETRAGLLNILVGHQIPAWLAELSREKSRGLSYEDVLDLFGSIAIQIQNRADRQIDLDAFKSTAHAYFERGIGTRSDLEAVYYSFYNSFVGERDRLFVLSGDGAQIRINGFLIEEFLSARHLSNSTPDRESFLTGNLIFESRWRETILFLAQLTSHKSTDDLTALLKRIENRPWSSASGSGPNQAEVQGSADGGGGPMEYAFRLAFHCLVGSRADAELIEHMVSRLRGLFVEKPYLSGFLADLLRDVRFRIRDRDNFSSDFLEKLQNCEDFDTTKKRSYLRALVALGPQNDHTEKKLLVRALCDWVRNSSSDSVLCTSFVEFTAGLPVREYFDTIKILVEESTALSGTYITAMLGKYTDSLYRSEAIGVLSQIVSHSRPLDLRLPGAMKGLALLQDKDFWNTIEQWLSKPVDNLGTASSETVQRLKLAVGIVGETRERRYLPRIKNIFAQLMPLIEQNRSVSSELKELQVTVVRSLSFLGEIDESTATLLRPGLSRPDLFGSYAARAIAGARIAAGLDPMLESLENLLRKPSRTLSDIEAVIRLLGAVAEYNTLMHRANVSGMLNRREIWGSINETRIKIHRIRALRKIGDQQNVALTRDLLGEKIQPGALDRAWIELLGEFRHQDHNAITECVQWLAPQLGHSKYEIAEPVAVALQSLQMRVLGL